ncbi:acyl carrier protein [Actinokineospora auranticolor]|uniref:Acyl carrier protein n=1 Tax=Actinokineospora auranticolor TaxID=155976 RepID=A0A2S6GI59_9PSEU|nr:acyl carrier protein [Actinokineospora auranticolor]PPK64914.1 acyl carrier protein [Actinokineospora auranticolor]
MTTSLTEITATVTGIAAAEIGVPAAELAPETDLRGVEGVDSVKVLRMIAKIEREFDIELEDEDVFGVSTVAEVAAVVEKALGAK